MPKATRKKKEKQADFVVRNFMSFMSSVPTNIDSKSRKPNSNLVRARSRLRTLPIHPSKRDVSQCSLIICHSIMFNIGMIQPSHSPVKRLSIERFKFLKAPVHLNQPLAVD